MFPALHIYRDFVHVNLAYIKKRLSIFSVFICHTPPPNKTFNSELKLVILQMYNLYIMPKSQCSWFILSFRNYYITAGTGSQWNLHLSVLVICQEGGTIPHKLVDVAILKVAKNCISSYSFLAYLVVTNVARDVQISWIKLICYPLNHHGTSKNLTGSTEEK